VGLPPSSSERRLLELGIRLPDPPSPFGSYVETLQTGDLLFLSGMLPAVDHKPKSVGSLKSIRWKKRPKHMRHAERQGRVSLVLTM
jgi:hypothetical protein